MSIKYRVSFIALMLLLCCSYGSSQQLGEMYRHVKPSVVIVHSGRDDQSDASPGRTDDSGLGSGVLISKDGKILTAAHVVEGGQPISVEFATGQRARAEIVAVSGPADVALLQVDRLPDGSVPAKLGDSDLVETGDDIFIVGAPYGLSNTLTVGRVSARRPDETRGGILSTNEFLQTDAVVNPGNSGSPVFNKQGEVVGIVSCVASNTGDFKGVGFAATVNSARTLLIDRDPFLTGLEGVLITGVVAKALNVPQPAGFLVTGVTKDSLADRMGLAGGEVEAVIDNENLLIGGDVILKINGNPITIDRRAYRSVFSNLARSNAGSTIRCTILRAGKIIDLTLSVPSSVTKR